MSNTALERMKRQVDEGVSGRRVCKFMHRADEGGMNEGCWIRRRQTKMVGFKNLENES